MGLILKDKLDVLMKGYPTVSDKYNVRGATLQHDSPVGHFGDIIKFGDGGFFKVVNSTDTLTAATEVAGVLLATNVKLVDVFGGGNSAEAPTYPDEAFNLMLDGYVALELKEGTDLTTIKEGLQVGLTAEGKLELSTESGAVVVPWYFTGITFTDDEGRLLAEVDMHHVN